MRKSILLFSFCSIWVYGFTQNCVTQELDSRSPELKQEVERQLSEAEGSSARSVTYIQTVVHVLWGSSNDNLSDSVIQANIDLVNRDLRRQNTDTSETPDYFLPVAADTEIELRLAQVDPNGQPTNGITHTYTDSTEFYYEFGHMKYDSTGGKTAWDTENYLNIWVVRDMDFGIEGGGTMLGISTLPGSAPIDQQGLCIRADQFDFQYIGWRTITHTFGHFACLLHTLSNTCVDADSVSDTPIAVGPQFVTSCSDTIVSCNNGPYGNMFMNYMSYATCMNMFTHGQKDRMFNCIETQYPGLTDYQFLGVDDVAKTQLELYPNPTHDQLNFQSSDKGNLSVLDLSGRTILSFPASKGKNKINVESLPSGIYLLQLETGQGVSAARLIKN
jgi:hypothetical protein